MQRNILLLVLVVSAFFVSGCTSGGELFKQSVQRTAPKSQKQNTGKSFAPVSQEFIDPYGTVLTTTDGKPLYTFTNDMDGESTCYDECSIVWPPLLVSYPEEVGGMYRTTQRTDGLLQVTYNGQPLYTYTPDMPYKVTGDGKNGEWSVVVVE
ncbi:MAG: hypothetical protein BroJett025_03010 [Patescibacteria group bacterium]|nr:MAG: hypothetical protein BroJett025_03010 [Patescibacteria group bacterium]